MLDESADEDPKLKSKHISNLQSFYIHVGEAAPFDWA